jgi:hypothetical protein
MRALRLTLATLVFLVTAFAQDQPASPAQPAPSPQPAATQNPAGSTPVTPYGEITGTVKSGNLPVPGVTITAANSLTGKKYVTSTAVDGTFKLALTGKGRYVVRAEFTVFAPATQEIVINDQNRSGKADLNLQLASRVQQQESSQASQQIAQAMTAAGRAGMQQLALSSGGGGDLGGPASSDPGGLSALPNSGLAAEGNNESVSVSGAMGRADQNLFDPGEMQDRLSDIREQLQQQGGGQATFNMNGVTANIQILGGGGGFGGGGFGGAPGGPGGGPMVFMIGGPGGGGGGRGGRGRGFNVNRPHGSIFYDYGGSILDARPYSLNGIQEPKTDYNQNHFGINLGGPLNIPHVYSGGTKTFVFGAYNGSRSSSAYDVFSTVPTVAERSGNFSDLLAGPAPVQLFDPVTHAAITNNQLSAINPTAAALLSFIPQPNLPGTSRNFHFLSSTPSDSDTAFIRFNHSFSSNPGDMFGFMGPRAQQRQQARQAAQGGDKKKEKQRWSHSINGGFSYNNLRSTLLNPFPGLGGKQNVQNFNGNFGYSAVKGRLLNSLRFNYNHSGSQATNQFTNVNDIEAQLGIGGVSQFPADFGLPVLNFAPQFTSLQDVTPQNRTNQNYTISNSMSYSHGKHSWTWGGDVRHQLVDIRNSANARGTFTFTGSATLDPALRGGIGSEIVQQPFADFLLGLAQQTSIQFGASTYHFSSNSFDLFAQDNWRAGKNLTFNLGLRYEFVNPLVESNNQLANLDVAPDLSHVALVLPGQVGPITGRKYGDSLIHPDRNNFAPRVGVAWKPYSKTVVRAGYGVNYNLAQYGSMATQLGFQPPFAVAQTNTADPLTNLTGLPLQNGFPVAPAASPNHITNTYAVDPNYRLPYVQSWNLNIQQEIKTSLVVNIGYTGSKGTHLDIVRAPDQLQTGGPRFLPCTPATAAATDCVQPFLFESSEGSSILHAGSVRVRKRLRHGISVGGTYTYSKSIDNASSIGGGAVVVAQNDQDLGAERGLSSFDQRHRFTGDYLYQLPFGKDKKWLNSSSFGERVLSQITFSGNVTVASGHPFSPRFFGSGSDLSRGTLGTVRPDLVPGASLTVDHPTIQQWFNTAAFTAPTGVFGDAGRNIIIGPGTVDFGMSVSKNVQLREMQGIEFRLSASNIFNTAHFSAIDTTLGSRTFGQVTSVGSMRKAQLLARYRF